MANKRLKSQEIQEMKQMVSQGIAPDDIAKHFDIAISSVHNYKKRFKEEGLQFPSVKGKRPTGSVDVHVKPLNLANSTVKPIGQINSPTSLNQDDYKFIINGVSVKISGKAKNVNIGKDHMEINF